MRKIEVATGDRHYPVLIEAGLLDAAGEHLAPLATDRKLVVVSDEVVWDRQGARLGASLDAAGVDFALLLVPPGEASKSWTRLGELLDRLLALEVRREHHLVAFGGGVVGDLVGFAASILKRGCGFVQVPTTLLAQVDSSVGGKTGINLGAGKNLVGSFHQPSLVLIDPSTLDTLPLRQARAGYAEVVKYGLIGNPAFFAWCEAHGEALLRGDTEARLHAIGLSIAAKADIVAADERETRGVRALLNLGHTFGHALEAASGFSERMLHGEAVAIGMNLAFRFSAERRLCAGGDADRVEAHLAAVGLPTGFDADPDELVHHIRQDKKARAGTVPFILARGIGRAFVDDDVHLEDVRHFLARTRRA